MLALARQPTLITRKAGTHNQTLPRFQLKPTITRRIGSYQSSHAAFRPVRSFGEHPLEPAQLSISISCTHRKPCRPFFKNGRGIHDGTVCEDRRGIAPLRLLTIEHSQVPKYPFALAAARLRGKLVAQCFGDEMVMVPVLDNPWVCDSGLNHPAGSRPICRQNWLPHHQDTDRQ